MADPITPSINLSLCNHCTLCAVLCPEDALTMREQGPVFNIPLTCTYCLECEGLCPTGAIRAPLTVTWGAQSESINLS
jgi:formate hydrogenlyase subunit 6/NADH:ubiquinone oxidoreductase subunit I